jgi:inner membrane protein
VPLWSEARVLTGVSDTRGIRDAGAVVVNGRSITLEPVPSGTGDPNVRQYAPLSGVTLAGARVPELETLTGRIKTAASLRISGADRLAIGPFAKDTSVSIDSNWSDPSFSGGVLPLKHNSGEGPRLQADWKVAYLARDIPGAGTDLDLGRVTMEGHRDMGVRFMREANPYQSVERALKYAAMFVGLVFLTYFLLEILSGARAHPAQYILVGLAQAIFYLLLLAFAEQQGFDLAFLIAAVMTVTLTSLYAASVFKSWGYGARAFAVLTGIYALIYTLMRLEDMALLAGALASFVAIALTMYVTRNIDWYGARGRETV